MRDWCVRHLVILYLKVGYRACRLLGIRLRGIGIAVRRLNKEFDFSVEGRRFAFLPECSGAYCLLPAGIWNEPETPTFFHKVLAQIDRRVVFLDVCASVGEMAVEVAAFPCVEKVIAFEPQRAAVEAIRASSRLNKLANIEVVHAAVGNSCGRISFTFDQRSPTASHIQEAAEGIQTDGNVDIVNLDSIKICPSAEVLLLIDVEGFEPAVMRGGSELIRKSRPLIIFEYNMTSKAHYSLEEIRTILGSDYAIYKLTEDGRLGESLQNTWNCVALHKDSFWTQRCSPLLCD